MIKLYGKPIRVNKVCILFARSIIALRIASVSLFWITYQFDIKTHLLMFSFQASQDKKSLDVGANLFVGNLDPVSDLNFLMTL